MYTIILGLDGKYHCQFRLQDGTEYYVEDSLESAIKGAKAFAKAYNHSKIKKKDITFLRERQVAAVEYDSWKP
jgi:hypothetical protein